MIDTLRELCRNGPVVLFGSANRPEDFSRYFSDVNVLTLGGGRVSSVNERISLVQMDPDALVNRCYYGDPLCIWLVKDSKVLCGSLPELKFIVTTWTIDSIRQLILNNVALMYENVILGNSSWALNNAYYAVKLTIILRIIDSPTLRDLELAKLINGGLSKLLLRLHDLRIVGGGIDERNADEVAGEVGAAIGIRLPTVSRVREGTAGNPYASIQCDNYGCLTFNSSEEPWDYYYL